MPANTTPSALWAAYRRLVAREAAASREADAACAMWNAAVVRRRELVAEVDAAHRAYLQALDDTAVVAAAEDIAFNLPHLFTD